MENNDRRKFLKQMFFFAGTSALGSQMLSSCSKDIYQQLRVVSDRCTACGACLVVCKYSSIKLDSLAAYSIDQSKCTLCKKCLATCAPAAIAIPGMSYSIKVDNCTTCKKCQNVCPESAITITPSTVAQSSYTVSSTACVGCGDCIVPCQSQGNAITYIKQTYTVGSNCHGCVQICSSRCSYGAISKVNGHSYINTSKCVKCGKCYAVCPHSAISKAYVTINSSKCTNCGKCYTACTHSAIKKTTSGSSSNKVALINQAKCTTCGKCYDVCAENAIAKTESSATVPVINQRVCTSCGNCLAACNVQNAISVEITPASINQNNCVKCEKCITACKYGAIVKT